MLHTQDDVVAAAGAGGDGDECQSGRGQDPTGAAGGGQSQRRRGRADENVVRVSHGGVAGEVEGALVWRGAAGEGGRAVVGHRPPDRGGVCPSLDGRWRERQVRGGQVRLGDRRDREFEGVSGDGGVVAVLLHLDVVGAGGQGGGAAARDQREGAGAAIVVRGHERARTVGAVEIKDRIAGRAGRLDAHRALRGKGELRPVGVAGGVDAAALRLAVGDDLGRRRGIVRLIRVARGGGGRHRKIERVGDDHVVVVVLLHLDVVGAGGQGVGAGARDQREVARPVVVVQLHERARAVGAVEGEHGVAGGTGRLDAHLALRGEGELRPVGVADGVDAAVLRLAAGDHLGGPGGIVRLERVGGDRRIDGDSSAGAGIVVGWAGVRQRGGRLVPHAHDDVVIPAGAGRDGHEREAGLVEPMGIVETGGKLHAARGGADPDIVGISRGGVAREEEDALVRGSVADQVGGAIVVQPPLHGGGVVSRPEGYRRERQVGDLQVAHLASSEERERVGVDGAVVPVLLDLDVVSARVQGTGDHREVAVPVVVVLLDEGTRAVRAVEVHLRVAREAIGLDADGAAGGEGELRPVQVGSGMDSAVLRLAGADALGGRRGVVGLVGVGGDGTREGGSAGGLGRRLRAGARRGGGETRIGVTAGEKHRALRGLELHALPARGYRNLHAGIRNAHFVPAGLIGGGRGDAAGEGERHSRQRLAVQGDLPVDAARVRCPGDFCPGAAGEGNPTQQKSDGDLWITHTSPPQSARAVLRWPCGAAAHILWRGVTETTEGRRPCEPRR